MYYPITPIRGDAKGYENIANNLLNGKGFVFENPDQPTVRRAPFFPIIVAGVYRITGGSSNAVRIMQIILDLGTILLLYIIGSQFFSKQVGMIAAGVWAFYLPAIAVCTVLITETFLAFLSTLTLLLLLKGMNDQNRKYSIILGVVIGLGILTRPTALLLIPFLGLVFLLIHKQFFKQHSRFLVRAFLIALLTISPWTIRNFVVFKAFVPVAFGGGQALYTGNHIQNDGIWKGWDDPDILEIRNEAKRLNPDPKMRLIIMDRLFIRQAVHSMVVNPVKTVNLFIKKGIRFLNGPSRAGYKYGAEEMHLWVFPIGIFAFLCYFLILIGFLLSFIRLPRQLFLWIPIIIVGYYILLHIVTFAVPRYHFPIMPILCLYSAFGYYNIFASTRILFNSRCGAQ